MKSISIFNHVLGPVMRGPSSSHTAGAFHIACMARSMLRDEPSGAALAVGRAMPKELLCTSQGGLAITPAARALKPNCCGKGCCS